MNGSVWRFAGFVYSPHSGLQRDGAQIHLGPQARQLLELLLESNGGVVTKSEIAARLWPGRPPSDDSIDRCAYLLRKPLRDAGFADLIATAYGRGLSLRADVETIDPESASPRSSEAPLDGRILDLWQIAYELAGTRTREGYERAQAAIVAASELDGASPAVWSLAGDIAAGRAIRGHLRPAKAAAMIERDGARALELAPKFAAALAVVGWARATLRSRPKEGLSLLDQAVAQDPQYSKARAYRCWALARLGWLDRAVEDIEAGLRVSPHDQGLLSMRAWLEMCRGNIDVSVKLAREGIKLRPDGGWLHSITAIAASLSGDHSTAVDWARRSVNAVPNDPALLAVFSYILASAGLESEAGDALSAAVVDEESAPPLIFIAAALLALGKRKEAVEMVGRARDEGCPWFAFALCDPRLASMRNEIGRLAENV